MAIDASTESTIQILHRNTGQSLNARTVKGSWPFGCWRRSHVGEKNFVGLVEVCFGHDRCVKNAAIPLIQR